MRSRDVSNGEVKELGKFQDVGSPVQEESDDDGPGGAGILVDSQTQSDTNAQRTLEDKILEEEDTTNEPTVGVGGTEALPRVSAQQPQISESIDEGEISKQDTVLSPQSGLANASSTSPFGAVKSSPPAAAQLDKSSIDQAATSSSAFASSGISAFASSEKSPFGATSTTQAGGGFGGSSSGFGGTYSGFGGGKPSSFASSAGGFGSTSSFVPKPSLGFGNTSGFGSTSSFGGVAPPRPFGGAVSSFGGGAAPGAFAKAKPFGAKEAKEDEDDEGSQKGDDDGPQQDEDVKQHSRFHQQKGTTSPVIRPETMLTCVSVETGEEDEETIFISRAKLFHFEDKQWKERGVGNIKINVRYEPVASSQQEAETNDDEGNEDEGDHLEDGITQMARRGRVLMRTDGVHRLILNSPVFKDMNVGTKDGEEPTGRTLMLTGMEDGRPKGFQVRVCVTHLAFDIC